MTDKHAASTPSESAEKGNVRFSVCAITDLLGFSSHLEISGYDLRTAIGEQAIQRLENLEIGISLARAEAAQSPEVVPPGLRLRRINDAVLCTMDLDDFLLPAIGETGFSGKSISDLAAYFKIESFDNSTNYSAAYESRLHEAIEPVDQFLGIVARLHLFIQKKEGASFFPGARTVVSTGFRRPFRSINGEDDHLSANFALANAFSADKSLHGPHLYVDSQLIELCSRDRLARNLMQFACYEWADSAYDCLRQGPPTEGVSWRHASEVATPETLILFRRGYVFRRLNASPLSYLQHLRFLRPCLEGGAQANRSNPYFAHVLDAVDSGMSEERVKNVSPPRSFLYGATNDLEVSITEFREMLLTGDSPTRRLRRRREYLEGKGHLELMNNEKFMAEMDALDERTVELDVDSLRVTELGDFVWQLSEEQLTAMLPLMGDDIAVLAFPRG